MKLQMAIDILENIILLSSILITWCISEDLDLLHVCSW
jgi:hypothetical protein